MSVRELEIARKHFRMHPTEANAKECERIWLEMNPEQRPPARRLPDHKRDDFMRKVRARFDEGLREMALECGAESEEEIGQMTAWEVVVCGVRYRGDASK